jgi:glycosyltransferase involved in cell wall biosynthesis
MVVVPSLEDNLPNVALEAIACGTPVAGFDICGMPDIVRDGWNGVLAPQRDAAVLGHAIAKVLPNDSLLSQMRINARLHAEARFSIENQAHAYLSLYTELSDNHRAARSTHCAMPNVF